MGSAALEAAVPNPHKATRIVLQGAMKYFFFFSLFSFHLLNAHFVPLGISGMLKKKKKEKEKKEALDTVYKFIVPVGYPTELSQLLTWGGDGGGGGGTTQ